jgi:hypothetical protein
MNKTPNKIIISHVGRDHVVRIPERTIDRRPVIEPAAVCMKTAAKMFGISVPILQKLTRSGELKSKRVGQKIMILTKNLKDFLGGEN